MKHARVAIGSGSLRSGPRLAVSLAVLRGRRSAAEIKKRAREREAR